MLDNQLWRLIPAHAGKTVGLLIRQASEQAHPRSRGENQDENVINLSKQGSSPLTRGKPCLVRRRCQLRRLIPAHAGKTRYRTCRRQPSGAHPRSRGENTAARGDKIAGAGSSPLTRGKLPGPRDSPSSRGLIPAHAGKTRHYTDAYGYCRAHPRSRGENCEPRAPLLHRDGSSPLTRGKPKAGLDLLLGGRLIPAHAGKTTWTTPCSRPTAAHPRSRGENYMDDTLFASDSGSSPLTRGKLRPRRSHALRRRLIPAHAGKTKSSACLMSSR